MSTYGVPRITAFLYAGALQHPNPISTDYEPWQGHTGFVYHCTEFATAIDSWLRLRPDEDNFPGVMEYELIEPLGEWLIEQSEQPKLPTTAQVLARFQSMYLPWIAQGQQT